MGGSHWLLLIPYYFFCALASLLLLILVTRVTRIRLSLNALATTSVVVGLAVAIVPISAGWLTLGDYSVGRMFLIVAASCVLALVDAVLQRWLSLPLDKELAEL